LEVGSLEAADDRRFDIKVAGPSLLVPKLDEIAKRVRSPGRAEDKEVRYIRAY
jgi:hypothetical protein